MNFFQRVSLLFYSTFVMFVAVFWIALSLGYLNYQDFIKLLHIVYTDDDLKHLAGLWAGFLLVLNYIFYRILAGNVRRDKIYTFENPNGRVSVSLFALEDLIKRTLLQFNEIKDARPTIRITNKEFLAKIPLQLKSESSIPEITSMVQLEVLRRIKDTIGINEKVTVEVYIGKIYPLRSKEKIDISRKSSGQDRDSNGPIVPFQGYGA
ncbi:MAG: alkaline shock response membrane anchor protein AmaP [Candidatus Omnitrophica bacterium]|nr:alkaline shock response membrane anchor protein AmaP [Candidatus Omnitrophota bacterium]